MADLKIIENGVLIQHKLLIIDFLSSYILVSFSQNSVILNDESGASRSASSPEDGWLSAGGSSDSIFT